MSDSKAGAADSSSEDSGPKPSKLPLLVALINTVVVLVGVGALTYTKLIFKRPPITEEGERMKIEAIKIAKPAKPTTPGEVSFDATTINIASTPVAPKSTDGNSAGIGGKLHYATVGFSIEIRDADKKSDVEALKPLITDQFLTLMGKKQFNELTSVQGRYVLKTQVLELANDLWNKRQKPEEGQAAGTIPDEPLFTNVYFSQFIVQ